MAFAVPGSRKSHSDTGSDGLFQGYRQDCRQPHPPRVISRYRDIDEKMAKEVIRFIAHTNKKTYLYR